MHATLRRLWLATHRWVALALGWLLVLAACLGSLLTVAKPLDQWAHPALFRQPAAAAAELEAPLANVRDRLQQEFGAANLTFRPPRQPGDTLWVYVHGPWDGIAYFDASGRELGRRGETEGLYNLLFELHSTLLLGVPGQAVLVTVAGTYLLLLLTGLVLWWPRRWPPSFMVHWHAGALRWSGDLHTTAGALGGLLIAVSVASGAYMAWPPLRTLVSSMAGDTPARPPLPTPIAAARPAATLDEMVRTARAVFPAAMVGYVQVPAVAGQAVRVRLKLPDDPHPNGLSSVWLHPASGKVLKVLRWSGLDAGNRLVATVYPLHTGALGGPWHQVLVGLTGLALAMLGGSGLLLWWQRRRARRGRALYSARVGRPG